MLGVCPPAVGGAMNQQGVAMTATATETDVAQIVDRYLAAWNETDPAARRELIARTWLEDGTYLDPLLSGAGHDGINAMMGAAQPQFAVLQFRRTSEVDAHHDVVRFFWALGPELAPALSGLDFGVIAEDGRFRSVTGFFDFMPQTGE
jgi:hypothetical protein